MTTIKKIVVIGPESTGKSTLCEKLSVHYNTLWVPEYAREYLEKRGAAYAYKDLLSIAKGQIELEERHSEELEALRQKEAVQGDRFLFIDTDMNVMKVWSEFVFNDCDNWILNQIAERKYDLYLLCDIDLPWIEDALREYPDKNIRRKLFRFYKEIMVNQHIPWQEIAGSYEERFEKAVKCIDARFT